MGAPGAAGDAVRAGRRRRRRAARGADLRVRRARPGGRRDRLSQTPPRLRALGGARRRRLGRRRPARRARVRERAERDRHAPQRDGRLERPAARRRAPAARRCSRRSTRSSARAGAACRSRPGSAGWSSRPCRCRSRGCGCAALAATGLVDAPAGLIDPRRWAAGTSGIVAVVSAIVVAALAWFGARALARAIGSRPERRGGPERPSRARRARGGRPRRRHRDVAVRAGGARVGAQPLRCGSAGPRRAPVAVRRHRLARVEGGRRARCAGLLVPVLALVHLSLALELGPLQVAWAMAIAAMTGSGVGTMLLFAGLLAALAAVVRVLLARRRLGPAGRRLRQAVRHPRPAVLRRAGLARRHRVGAAAMSAPAARRSRGSRRAARALDRADRLGHAPARGRGRDARVGGAGVLALRALPAGRAVRRARPARAGAAAARGAARDRQAPGPEAEAGVRRPLAGPPHRRRRRGRAAADRPDRALQRRDRGHERRRPAPRPRPLPRARRCPASAGRSGSPGTAPPTARRSARSTRSGAATTSS